MGLVILGFSGGSFRCLALEMLGGSSAPLSMWGCERDHGTRGTHELHLSLPLVRFKRCYYPYLLCVYTWEHVYMCLYICVHVHMP